MNHEASDRVPVDLWLDLNDPEVKNNLLAYTQFDSYEKLLDYLDIDLFRFMPGVLTDRRNPKSELEKFFIPSSDPRQMTLSGEFPRPLFEVEHPEDLDKFIWPDANIFDYDGLIHIIKEQEKRILWVQPGSWSPIFCRMCDLAGMEKILMDMLANPRLIEALVERITDFYLESFKRTLDATRERIDIFSFGDDYASQTGMIFDIETWRKYFKKPLKKLCNLVKSYGVYISFHSCGAVTSLIPELIELGVDILFPIQPKAFGMEAQHLKREFGKDIVFYGGIDIQEILPYGTENQVREEVRRVSGILGKSGGYIMASGHGILSDVPQTNILAMYDEIKRIAYR